MATGPELSAAEREVLRVLWELGQAPIRAVNEELERQGRRWAYTTVATLLQRLCVKKYVAVDGRAVPHVYQAVVSRDDLLKRRLKDAADELCDGHAAPLVLALVQGNRFSREELKRLKAVLDQAVERGGSGPKPSV